jgi:hypothetical protein
MSCTTYLYLRGVLFSPKNAALSPQKRQCPKQIDRLSRSYFFLLAGSFCSNIFHLPAAHENI